MTTLLWILTGTILAQICLWTNQRASASIAGLLLTVAFTLGWGTHPEDVEHVKFVAQENGALYHDPQCWSIREAVLSGENVDLMSDERAKHSHLRPHHCVIGNHLVTMAGE